MLKCLSYISGNKANREVWQAFYNYPSLNAGCFKLL